MRSIFAPTLLAAALSVQGAAAWNFPTVHAYTPAPPPRPAPPVRPAAPAHPAPPAPPAHPAPPAPPGHGAGGACPAIWFTVAKNLVGEFSTNGQCNELARAAIRASFHDCGSWDLTHGTNAGCDGSLFLAAEYNRSENAGLDDSVPTLGALAQQFGVGMADFFQFAAAVAIVVCPLGPTVRTFVGRPDRSTPNPEGLLPSGHDSGASVVANMKRKGISPSELSALLGAHSTADQDDFDPSRAKQSFDTTPGIWDVDFYGQTLDGTAPFILPSDIGVAQDPEAGPSFHSFVNNQGAWNVAFSAAMTKMGLMGVPTAGLIDCTAALPAPGFAHRLRRSMGRRTSAFAAEDAAKIAARQQ